ncbi:MAG: arsenate reductase [Bacteroidia bacterium]|nr:MAG: arsenate reductase [Bacteroidia bacterium]
MGKKILVVPTNPMVANSSDMNPQIQKIIEGFLHKNISEKRKSILIPLAEYLQKKVYLGEPIRLNFICTHNSRRSHLAQIWAQTMAYYFKIPNVFCYSGGTEATAIFPEIIQTLIYQGFDIYPLSESQNSIYAIKYAPSEPAIIGFSKTYQHPFNPKNRFLAIMTCSDADEGCPVVLGAEARFSIPYEDPKTFDTTPSQNQKYKERSLEIAQEMWWIFRSIQK